MVLLRHHRFGIVRDECCFRKLPGFLLLLRIIRQIFEPRPFCPHSAAPAPTCHPRTHLVKVEQPERKVEAASLDAQNIFCISAKESRCTPYFLSLLFQVRSSISSEAESVHPYYFTLIAANVSRSRYQQKDFFSIPQEGEFSSSYPSELGVLFASFGFE